MGNPIPGHLSQVTQVLSVCRVRLSCSSAIHDWQRLDGRTDRWMDGPGTGRTEDGQFHTRLLLTAEPPVSCAINSTDIVGGKSISQYKKSVCSTRYRLNYSSLLSLVPGMARRSLADRTQHNITNQNHTVLRCTRASKTFCSQYQG